jgi:hypothetical protein
MKNSIIDTVLKECSWFPAPGSSRKRGKTYEIHPNVDGEVWSKELLRKKKGDDTLRFIWINYGKDGRTPTGQTMSEDEFKKKEKQLSFGKWTLKG